MKKVVQTLTMCILLLFGTASAKAALITFDAFLDGLSESPPNASPATGFGTVLLDDVADTITVNENWSGLLAPATLSHIHGPALPGVNAGVLFPLSGVPAATSGTIPQQVFAITAAQITSLESGLYYMNVHTSVFPGGEIRGQLAQVPEPSSIALLVMAAVAAMGWNWRRRKRAE